MTNAHTLHLHSTDHTNPTSPLITKPPELSEEKKLAAIKFPGGTAGKLFDTTSLGLRSVGTFYRVATGPLKKVLKCLK